MNARLLVLRQSSGSTAKKNRILFHVTGSKLDVITDSLSQMAVAFFECN